MSCESDVREDIQPGDYLYASDEKQYYIYQRRTSKDFGSAKLAGKKPGFRGLYLEHRDGKYYIKENKFGWRKASKVEFIASML